jgi:hypothetical protein
MKENSAATKLGGCRLGLGSAGQESCHFCRFNQLESPVYSADLAGQRPPLLQILQNLQLNLLAARGRAAMAESISPQMPAYFYPFVKNYN